MHFYKRMFIFSFISLLLTGCATVSPSKEGKTQTTPPKVLSWQERELALNAIHNWNLSGKVAVQTPQDAGSASLNWTQYGNRYIVSLAGPFGAQGIKLSGGPGVATLQTADGKTFTAQSPEALLAEKWGFHLPVSYLRYWIRGLPVPSLASHKQFDREGRISALSQQGFNVSYLDYVTINGIDLPNRIDIESSALKTKIVIHQWQFR